MVRFSNNLIGVLNIITFILSIPILSAGIWLARRATTDCEKFLQWPVIALGVFLLLVSLAGVVGACCRNSCLLWLYLLVMFILILLLFCFTVFALVVTNKGAGEAVSGRGFKEYRLGDYSNWLQKRVDSDKNWRRIKSCLQDGKVCRSLQEKNQTWDQFVNDNLSPIQNDQSVLCYDCQSCKAGVLANIKNDWKKVAIVNVVFLLFLIVVYSVGCCAFRNNRRDNAYTGLKTYP
ncbi:hypothetical protein GW17_00003023 [Ensete ventricosum]|nr:hypothetical protein GW17_00003023 [Ensete ventricosum]RZR89835.1 hypothetical protein BHM03_00017629 [Ensete ventricosum]